MVHAGHMHTAYLTVCELLLMYLKVPRQRPGLASV
jgi:hypothetical protein